MIRDRGVYLNVASPVAPLTVHDWSDARWADYLETLAKAGINRLYFYLWQDILSDFAASPERKDANRRLHERLRQAIGWAQKRRMKVFFLLAPTFVPRPIFDARPELRADIDYVRQGFSCLCPSKAESWPVMEALFDHEWGWFRKADGFQLWFYDPGGCLCAECRRDLCATLVRQADVFSRRVWASNPMAIFQISFWPVWAWEAQLGRKFGDELLDRLKAHFGARTAQIEIVDNAEVDVAFLDKAKARGFRTQGFLFSANVETPFVFLQPQPTYLAQTARRVAAQGWDGAFVHALTPGSKAFNTVLAARLLARSGERVDAAISEAARLCLGRGAGADTLAALAPEWERLLCDGSPDTVRADALAAAVGAAMARVPKARADWSEPIADSAAALAALVAGDAPRLRARLDASTPFRAVAGQSVAEFDRMAAWLKKGWHREHF